MQGSVLLVPLDTLDDPKAARLLTEVIVPDQSVVAN